MNKEKAILTTVELVLNGHLEADARFCQTSLSDLALVCNGCGAANAKFDFVPDNIWGLYIGYACIIHDFDYQMGTTEADRRFADARFKRNLQALIRMHGGPLMPARFARSFTYYYSVRLGGESAFWTGKAANIVTLT